MEIVKTQSEPILLTISKIEDTGTRAAVLYEHVKKTPVDLALVTVDHDQFPTIHRLVLTLGRGAVKMFLVMMLENLIKSLNITHPDKDQVMEMADELINDHPALKPEDYKVFFMAYKKGEYGPDYQRLDIFNLNAALRIFLNKRAQIHETALAAYKYRDDKKVKDGVDVYDIYAKLKAEADERFLKSRSISLRDKHRRAAADAYAAELQAWCDANGKFIDDESAVVEFAAVKPFTMEYIDNFISKTIQDGR